MTYQFTCPGCQHRFDVGRPVLEATVEHGCPLCGRSVTPDHFAPC